MTLLLTGLALVLLAGALARLLERWPDAADRAYRWGMLTGCLTGAGAAVMTFAPGHGATGSGPTGAAYGLDPLSAWFTIIILGVGATISVYGSHYLARERPHRRVGSAHLLLAILLVALTGVVTARSIVTFLVAWEVMAVSAWLLVIFEREQPEVRRAGLVYLVMTHASTIALFGMFAAWGGGVTTGGSFEGLAVAAAEGRTPVALVL
ncbi:MAG TPA: proton-conducting transporter membrane subunit, partial [Gemmatimonadales bacterium]